MTQTRPYVAPDSTLSGPRRLHVTTTVTQCQAPRVKSRPAPPPERPSAPQQRPQTSQTRRSSASSGALVPSRCSDTRIAMLRWAGAHHREPRRRRSRGGRAVAPRALARPERGDQRIGAQRPRTPGRLPPKIRTAHPQARPHGRRDRRGRGAGADRRARLALMLLDANLLLFAVDRESPFHTPARDWLGDVLNGDRRVGLPWQSLGA